MKEKKPRIFNGILIVISLLGVALFLTHILGFTPHDYFYKQHPDVEKYVGVNVVSAYADFSFFTYHTVLFFCVWLFLFALSNLCRWKKLNTFTRRNDVLSFLTVNYIFTFTLYTLFELTSGNITFGLYANTLKAVIGFITNIIFHDFFFALMLTLFIKIKPSKEEERLIGYGKKILQVIVPLSYLIVYYVGVKITGMYCYQIVWYPYPIFDAESLSALLGLGGISDASKLVLLIACILLLAAIYMTLYLFLIKIKRKQK